MLLNSFYAILGTFYTLLNNTDLDLSYFDLSYVFPGHIDSVKRGLTVLNYRWQSLRSTNPGTLKSGNCFELPSEQGQLRVSNRGQLKQLLIILGCLVICTSQNFSPVFCGLWFFVHSLMEMLALISALKDTLN